MKKLSPRKQDQQGPVQNPVSNTVTINPNLLAQTSEVEPSSNHHYFEFLMSYQKPICMSLLGYLCQNVDMILLVDITNNHPISMACILVVIQSH